MALVVPAVVAVAVAVAEVVSGVGGCGGGGVGGCGTGEAEGVQDGQEDGEIDGKKFGEIIIIGECFRGSVKDRGKNSLVEMSQRCLKSPSITYNAPYNVEHFCNVV